MPIQCNITQPSGAVATYHVITSVTVAQQQLMQPNQTLANVRTAQANYVSWIDNQHYLSSAPSLGEGTIDTSLLLPQADVVFNGTIGDKLFGVVEQYLLTTPTFSGGTIVS